MNASVVIPTLNEEDNIGNVLRDLQDQTEKCEAIVVDSFSRDATVEIAESYGARAVVEKSTIGKARHIGTLKASCDKVLQTDADARIPPEWAEKHVINLDDYYIVTGPVEQPLDHANAWFNLLYVISLFYGANFGLTCLGANLSYRKSKYVGFDDVNIGEDACFIQKWSASMVSVDILMIYH